MQEAVDETVFREEMARRGFSDCYYVDWEALRHNPEHSHPFVARGLVLQGDFVIATPAWTRRFGAGEVFEVAAGTPHSETVGAEGIRLIGGCLSV